MTSLLEVSSLRRVFGTLTAVDDVTFDVQGGEVFGLLGPNGAGKSTTMMMICGLLQVTSGSVRLNGHEVAEEPMRVRQQLGVVPQDLAIYPDLTAEENLRFFGGLYGLSGTLLKEQVDEALRDVGLTARRHDASKTFSGGMKRRLNFAAAILHQPQLLILDEPTVGVDPQSRSHLLNCIRQLQKQGTTVIYASHYMEEVQAICSRVAVLDHGRILTCDTLSELLAQVPQEIELILPADTAADQLSLPPETTQTMSDRGLSIRFRSEGNAPSSLNQELAGLVTQLSEKQIPLLHIQTHDSSLERLFLQLTGTRLRD